MESAANIANVRQKNAGSWHTRSLFNRLSGTARLAREFATAFNKKDWSKLLGW